MPNGHSTHALDAIEKKHTRRDGNLLTLDVAAALDELLGVLEAMTPAERTDALLL